MTEWEEKLPSLLRERLARIGEATQEEKERMKDSEQVDSLVSELYRGELDAEGLWKRLKESKEQGKQSLLKEVQMKLIESLNPWTEPADFRKRKDDILAIETLKDDQNTSTLEGSLNSIEASQRRHEDELQQAFNTLKAQVEKNPQLRMEQVKQGQNTVVVELTVEEAVKRSPQWQGFLSQQDKGYKQEFAKAIETLKVEVK